MDSSVEDLSQNMPAIGSMYLMNSSIFGNTAFMIEPSRTGEVSNSFGLVPYFSLEAQIFMQSMNAQTTPTNILPGQNTGQQNYTGALTVTNEGNVQVQVGSGSF